MAYSLNDMDTLRQNSAFLGRVRASIIQGSISVGNEGWTIPFHRERQAYCVQIMNNPDAFAPLFASAIACSSAVINLATSSGTVGITTANSSTQQALVDDGTLNSAVGSVFGSFLRTPA